MSSHENEKARLIARKTELQARVAKSEAELDQPGDPDIEEQASARQSDEAIEGVEAAALDEIRKIDAALARISAGVFGACVTCGEPISSERLEAVPHAAQCRDCA